ncbi:bacteriocin immunity protein [Escherichia coli]|uniref:bacteriocin immunity protein n=1 Tax=Escherichia coli TaxID=562 RepID=UPI0023B9D783|nr:bacteriocin immunity protein [Escherichia coli]MCL9918857.1 bacteriocin immunity protein [Escherichia coli]
MALKKSLKNSTCIIVLRLNIQLKGEELDKYWDDLEEHLTRITQHPLMSDLIYYPAKKGDDEPENILKIVKEWRRSQGLPLFKDSK